MSQLGRGLRTSLEKRTSAKAWAKANPSKVAGYKRDWVKRNPLRWKPSAEKSRWYTIKYKYGLTRARFNEILAEQGGTCAACGSSDPGRNGVFNVDHDHTVKPVQVRGLLCWGCNISLGHLKDSLPRVEALVAYRRKFI